MKKSKKRTIFFIILFISVAALVIGYAALQTTLNITGNTSIKGNSWDVHWANVQVKSGSTTDVITPATITNPTQVEFNINLNAPGDYYEFTVDAVNAGTIDAMVDVVSKKVLTSSNIEIDLPTYLTYDVTYQDGIPIEQNQLLAANSSETILVRVEYKRDITEDDLVTSNTSIKFRFGLTYEQSNEESVKAVRTYVYSNNGNTKTGNPSISISNSYLSPDELFSSTPYDFFVRYSMYNDTIYSAELGFLYNNKKYYLSTVKSAEDFSQELFLEERKTYLTEIFGSDNCYLENNGFSYHCEAGSDMSIKVNRDGYLVATNNGNYVCSVYPKLNGISVECGSLEMN